MENDMQYASPWRRFGAMVVDSVVLNVGLTIVTLLILLPVHTYVLEQLAQLNILLFIGGFVGVALLQIVLSVLYYVIAWSRYNGKTVGYALTGAQLVTANGGPVSIRTGLVRLLGTIPATLPLGLGYVWVLWDKKRQGWHDKIAGTYVVTSGEPRYNWLVGILIFFIAFAFVEDYLSKQLGFEQAAVESVVGALVDTGSVVLLDTSGNPVPELAPGTYVATPIVSTSDELQPNELWSYAFTLPETATLNVLYDVTPDAAATICILTAAEVQSFEAGETDTCVRLLTQSPSQTKLEPGAYTLVVRAGAQPVSFALGVSAFTDDDLFLELE